MDSPQILHPRGFGPQVDYPGIRNLNLEQVYLTQESGEIYETSSVPPPNISVT